MKKLLLIVCTVLSINPMAYSDLNTEPIKSSHISSDGENVMTSEFYTKDKEFRGECVWNGVKDFTTDYVLSSISKDGKTILVGQKGSVDIYTISGDKWWEKPTANISIEGEVTHNCYPSISGDGKTALLICHGDIYVYTKKGNNNWDNDSNKFHIDHPNDVAISGDGTTILVGNSWQNVYVYTRKDKDWTGCFICKYFNSIAMSNDGKTIIVGIDENDPTVLNELIGKVYIYTKDENGSWNRTGTFSTGLMLGCIGSVSVSGNGKTIMVGGLEAASKNDSYCVHIYTKNNNGWDQNPVFEDSFSMGYPEYGMDVSLSDDGETALTHTKTGTLVYTSHNPYQMWLQGQLER